MFKRLPLTQHISRGSTMSDQGIVFASMGMFIIDEIHFPNAPSVYNICGGGGTFGLLGSRVILSSKYSKQVGWIADYGSDCPQQIKNEIASWNTGVVVRVDNSRLTTRGWNSYGDNEIRHFKYLTEKKRIDVDDLIQYKQLLGSGSFHLICSPERCTEIMNRLSKERRANGIVEDPVIVWEPVPDNCRPEHLEKCLKILSTIDILSPNAQEAALFFGMDEPDNKADLENIASRFLPYLTKKNAGIILRCGKMGCYILNNQGLSQWLPAYHNPKNTDYKVVDATGGGNTFVGALATGFVKSHGDWLIGAICGNVGSGVAIEQIGMPHLSQDDKWNGLAVQERIELYLERNNVGIEPFKVYEILYS